MNKDALNEARLKSCEELLTKLWKNPNAPPFHVPVDPIELNVPDYLEKIKNPMDLSTIKSKLKGRTYLSSEQVKEDFKLMIDNCLLYNGRDSMVSKMACELDKQFNVLYNKLPTEESLSKLKRKAEVPVKTQIADKKIKRVEKSNISAEDQKMCEDILAEILKPKNHNIVWPFMEPITDDLVPGYSQLIKHPTDIKTIKKKINDMQFESADDLYKELKTMINNCYKYNNDTKKIYDCAIELEEVIDGLFMREKMHKDEIVKKITELKNKINIMERQVQIYEEKLSDDDKKKIIVEKEFTLDERLDIGNQITELNQLQTTKIAQIINKTGVHLDFIGRNEVEIDLRTLPDKCVGEIKEYLENVNEAKNTRCI